MFDGAPESRAKVSMRGKRKGHERTSLVNRAKEQREARAAERVRQDSALRIQRLVRGRRSACAARSNVREGWGQRVADLCKVAQLVATQTGQTFRPPPAVAQRLLREFLFFGGWLRADGSLEAMADILEAAAGVPPFWEALQQADRRGVPDFMLSLAAFFRVALTQVGRNANGRVVAALQRLLAPLTASPSVITADLRTSVLWALLAASVHPRDMAERRILRVLSPLYRLGQLPLLRAQDLLALEDTAVWPMVDAGVWFDAPCADGRYDAGLGNGLGIRGLLESAAEEVVCTLYGLPPSSAGGRPGFRLRRQGAASSRYLLERLLRAVTRHLERAGTRLVGDGEGALFTPQQLRHLSEHLLTLPLDSASALRRPLVRLLGICTRHLPFRHIVEDHEAVAVSPRNGDEDATSRGSLLERAFLGHPGFSAEEERAPLSADVIAAMGKLMQLMQAKSLLLGPLQGFGAPGELLEVATFCAHLMLLNTSMLQHLGGAIDHWGVPADNRNFAGPVLNALAFGRSGAASSPLQTLWQGIAGYPDLGRHLSSRTYAPPTLLARAEIAPLLLVYFAGLSHALVATDDEDFFLGGKPVSAAIAVRTVHLLKQTLHALLWAEPQRLGDLVMLAVAVAASRLLRQLRERASRLRFSHFRQSVNVQLDETLDLDAFLDEGLWTWPATTVQDITSTILWEGDLERLSDAQDLLGAMQPEDTGLVGDMDIEHGAGGPPPRYEKVTRLLRDAPDLLPFQSRVRIFEGLLLAQKAVSGALRQRYHDFGAPDTQASVRDKRITVRRDQVFYDSYSELGRAPPLRGRLQVSFINEHGMQEAGIDGGGLLKEWMDAVCKEVFDPAYGFFSTTGDSGDEAGHQVMPAFSSGTDTGRHLRRIRFAGRILGKALYEGILVEPQLAPPFLNKLLGRYNHVDDLKFLDPGLHKGLMSMKKLAREGSTGGVDPVREMGLVFQVDMESLGAYRSIDLMPDGGNVPVTSASALQYIHLLAHFKLNVFTKAQSEAFLEGFRELIPEVWLRMFNASELQLLIGGDGLRPLDLRDLQASVHYGGGYHPTQPYIQGFWRIIAELTPEQQAKFLRFITSCSRQPLLGFRSLDPSIGIQKIPEDPPDRLPSAATCMNLLKLPQYADLGKLREKLVYAINSNAGFDLS